MFEAFASTQTMIAMTLFVMLIVLLGQAIRWRSLEAKKLYLEQCNLALQFPRFSNPELMKLDLREKTADGDAETFEAYEWFVARLVYVLDEVLRMWPTAQWHAVAETQLGNHKHYFASDYYAKQNYLPHYSARMRGLIEKQRGRK
jgi:hypothetical protein